MTSPLDRIDHAILKALQNDGRLSNKELAAQVGLAPSSCLERVRRLRADGVLTRFGAEVDLDALGVGLQAMITVQLQGHAGKNVETLWAHIQDLPELIAAYHVSGREDFMVHVAVRDTAHLRDLNLNAFAKRDEVAHISTALIFDHHRSPTSPNYL